MATAGAGALGASAALHGQVAPKLRSGASYAAWRQDMEVYLARVGVESALSSKRTADEWRTMVRSVEQWRSEDELEALASIGIGSLAVTGAITRHSDLVYRACLWWYSYSLVVM
jgi:hypothetical protein